MSVIHKLIKYSIEEVNMAECYIKLAKEISEPTISAKLQEMAKDELKHSDFNQSAAMRLIEDAEQTDNEEGEVEDMTSIDSAFLHVYSDWKDKVKYLVNTFELKK